MNKITILKFDIENELKPHATMGIRTVDLNRRYVLRQVEKHSVQITDEEIENEVNQRNKGFSVGKHIHKSDFLACWEYIKQRVNEEK